MSVPLSTNMQKLFDVIKARLTSSNVKTHQDKSAVIRIADYIDTNDTNDMSLHQWDDLLIGWEKELETNLTFLWFDIKREKPEYLLIGEASKYVTCVELEGVPWNRIVCYPCEYFHDIDVNGNFEYDTGDSTTYENGNLAYDILDDLRDVGLTLKRPYYIDHDTIAGQIVRDYDA